jgi:hypothetical protein
MFTRMTLSYWSPRAALVAAFLCAAPVMALPAAADDVPSLVPSLVHRAVTQYAAEHHGLLGFSRHVNFTMHAGPLSRDVRNDVGVLMQDGAYTRVRYYNGQTDAKTDDAKDLQRQEDDANADLAAGRGFVKRPVDPRFVADYRFASADCADCAAGRAAFSFTSVVHDRQHGHGTLIIDNASGRVDQISYTLDRAPDHAASGEVVETFGEALPGLWTCLHVEETYRGHLGPIGGTATMTTTLDHFRRFAQVDTALAAMASGSL